MSAVLSMPDTNAFRVQGASGFERVFANNISAGTLTNRAGNARDSRRESQRVVRAPRPAADWLP